MGRDDDEACLNAKNDFYLGDETVIDVDDGDNQSDKTL